MTLDLFEDIGQGPWGCEPLSPGAVVLRRFAAGAGSDLAAALQDITVQAPFRHMVTPGGFSMSVAMTNCGAYGWVSDPTGYRYAALDPESGKPWPSLPEVFLKLAQEAAAKAGFVGFTPDVCLINRYAPGARLSLHQDKDERDFSQPIVSASLGLPAVFLWGGLRRREKPQRISLWHGDVVVWGGPARLRYHGVMPLQAGNHPLTDGYRINLTFRRAV
jgi:DNA oxidative demethylase